MSVIQLSWLSICTPRVGSVGTGDVIIYRSFFFIYDILCYSFFIDKKGLSSRAPKGNEDSSHDVYCREFVSFFRFG